MHTLTSARSTGSGTTLRGSHNDLYERTICRPLVNFLESNIKRVSPERRIIATISRADLERSIEYTAVQSPPGWQVSADEIRASITYYARTAIWSNINDAQRLLLAPRSDDPDAPLVDAQLQAGQHRVPALLRIAERVPRDIQG